MLSYERANNEDYKVLTNIIREAFALDKQIYGCGPELYETPEMLLEYISSRRVWKIQQDNIDIGCIVVFINRGEASILGCIAIKPEYQNQGIGTKSLEWLEYQYKAVRIWRLETPTQNIKTRHFYEKNNFIKIGETNDDIALTTYEKNLDAPIDDPNGGCLYRDIANYGYDNLFCEELLKIQNIETQRIITRGQDAPSEGWFEHDYTTIMIVIAGYAHLDIDGKIYELRSGDWRCIHPHQKYRIFKTSREPACLAYAIRINQK